MTPDPSPIARALLHVAHDAGDDRALAEKICHICVDGTDVDGAAMSVLTASVHRTTLSTTDPVATALEDLQFTLGEGACIQAAVSGRPVLVPDLHDHHLTSRWPMFAAAVAERTDARALFALPLQLGTINLGVLDLYRAAPGPLRGDELRDVLTAADTACLLLLEAELRAGTSSRGGRPDHDDRAFGAGGPSDDRAEVHQATGMIVAQLGIPAQDAFARLRAYAFARRRPLGEVAHDVVARTLVFAEDME